MAGSLIKHFHRGFGDVAAFINQAGLLVSGISCRMFCRFFMQRQNLRVNKFCFVHHANSRKEMCNIGGILQADAVFARDAHDARGYFGQVVDLFV